MSKYVTKSVAKDGLKNVQTTYFVKYFPVIKLIVLFK